MKKVAYRYALLWLALVSIKMLYSVNSQTNAIVLDSNGNLVVGGLANNAINRSTDFVIARYLPDGSLDATFNPNGLIPGIVQLDASAFALPAGTDEAVTGLAIDSNGRILAVGFIAAGLVSRITIFRLNPNGSLDQTFNANGLLGVTPGIAVIGIGTLQDIASAVALDSQGRIVIVGSSDNGQSLDLVALRLTPEGELDTAFNAQSITPGIVIVENNGSDIVASAVDLYPDDSIVIGGTGTFELQTDFIALKLTTDGLIDVLFNAESLTPGFVRQDFQGFDDQAFGVKIDSQDRIIIGGFSSDQFAQEKFALARYTPQGDLDITFNPTGIDTGIAGTVLTAISTNTDVIRALTVTADNRIVVTGFTDDGIDRSFVTARYTPDGLLDPTFNPISLRPGIVIDRVRPELDSTGLALNNSIDEFHALVLGANGQMYNAGVSFDGVQNNITLISYLEDGQLNPEFNPGGVLSFRPGILITKIGEALNVLGNGVPQFLLQDVSGVSPDILKSLEYPPRPILPVIITDVSTVLSSDEKIIKGTASPTSMVSLYVDERIVGVALADTMGSWTITLPPLIEGRHELQAVSSDLLSGAQLSSIPLSFTVSREQILPPVIDIPLRNARVLTKTVTIEGRSPSALPVIIMLDGKEVAQIEPDSSGKWSYTTKPLAEGAHAFIAVVQQVKTQPQRLSSAQVPFVIQTETQSPRILSPKSGERIISERIQLLGEAPPKSIVELQVNGMSVGSAAVSNDGTWNFALLANPGPLEITAVSQASKRSSERVNIVFEKAVSSTTNEIGNLAGLIGGIALPASEVSLFVDNKMIGSTKADTAGRWAYTPPSSFQLKGLHPVMIKEIDSKGTTRLIERLITF